jgi:hypothetical protein
LWISDVVAKKKEKEKEKEKEKREIGKMTGCLQKATRLHQT